MNNYDDNHGDNQDHFESQKNWESLFDSVPIESVPREEHREQLKAQLIERSNQSLETLPRPQSTLQHIGSLLMKYKIPHLAAAAAMLIAFSTTFFSGGTQVLAIDNVLAKIINAKFARWDMEIDLGDTVSTMKVSITPERTRHDQEDGSYTVFDWPSGRSVLFFPGDKTIIELDTKTGGKGMQSFDMVKALNDSLKTQLELGLENVESLGERDFDGQTLTGFKIGPDDRVEIWADPETQAPVRIEILTGVEGAKKAVLKNYEFDVQFEEDFFSLEMPEGYTKNRTAVEVPTEDSLIESLRIYCEASGGTFPAALDINSTAEVSHKSLEYLYDKLGIEGQPTDEQTSAMMKAAIGFAILPSIYSNSKADPHYAGKDVKLGDKDRPIFWYRPIGSENYHVIYGDLRVEKMDSAPEVEGAVSVSIWK